MKVQFTFALLFLCLISTAQKEAYNWLFGEKVGLRFQENSPPSVLFGELNTLEGCASISDANGQLLFYSDGSNVWTGGGQLMPNGIDLLGDESSSQSAIIVPKPKNPNIYYLFTVGSTVVPTGFHYYTIDMTLNGGNGDVSEGPVNLTDGHGGSEWSEKITAVQGADCNTFWVISLVKDLFYAYKVDASGVSRIPYISQVGFESNISRGYLKISPDGRKLAAAHQGAGASSHGLYLYNFNNVTGEITGELNLFPNDVKQVYGVEFSSQTSKLYASTIDGDEYSLYQFDLNSSNITATAQLIHQEQPAFRGALQLGPDQKIYVTIPQEYTVGTNYLDVIHNPELDGVACNFQQDYVFLGNTNFSMQGLPPFIQSFFYVTEINIVNPYMPVSLTSKELTICKDEGFTLQGLEIPGAHYYWTFDDGHNEIELPTPNPPNQLTINSSSNNVPGTYKLLIDSNDECDTQLLGKANITFTDPPVINTFSSLTKCDSFDDNSSDGLTAFNLNNSLLEITNGRPTNFDVYFYLNDADAEADTSNLNSLPETFSNTIQNQIITTKVYKKGTFCYSLGQLELNVTPSSTVVTQSHAACYIEGIVNDFDLDEKRNDIIAENGMPSNTTITFYGKIEDALANENPISGLYEFTENSTIYFNVESTSQCSASGFFNLELLLPPPIDSTKESFSLCLSNLPISLNSSIDSELIDNYSYEWSTGDVSESLTINSLQTVSVLVTNKTTLCQATKTFTFNEIPTPIINDIDVDINDKTITVSTQGGSSNLFTLDDPNGVYQNNNVFEDVAAGIHTVYVKNDCGITQKRAYVLGFPKYFTPNDDSNNDHWLIKGLNVDEFSVTNIKIFNRYGKLLKTLHPNKKWDGTFNGEYLPATDYWFLVTLKDLNNNLTTYKGHFSLVR